VKKQQNVLYSHTRVQNKIRSDENTCPTLKSGKHQIESYGKKVTAKL